jgi:hypothetical protein
MSATREAWIVEFAGLQGSGKSSIARASAEALADRGIRVTHLPLTERRSHGTFVTVPLSAHLALLYRGLRYLAALRPRRIGRVSGYVRRADQLWAMARDGIVLADEGLVHRMILDAIERRAAPERRAVDVMRAFAAAARGPVAIIMVGSSDALIAERMRSADHAHCIFNQRSASVAAGLIQETHARYARMISAIESTTAIPVVHIDGAAPIAANAARVADAIVALSGLRSATATQAQPQPLL